MQRVSLMCAPSVGDVVVAATSSAASTPGVAPERVLTVTLSDATLALIATLPHAYPLSARPLCQIVAAPTASNATLTRLKHAMNVALSKSNGEPVERNARAQRTNTLLLWLFVVDT